MYNDDDSLQEQIARFQDAVRDKDNWVSKILDKKHDLGRKWAFEAGLLSQEGWDDAVDNLDEENNPALLALRELKDEATRIRILDYTIRIQSVDVASKYDVNFELINPDVFQAVKYARGSKYALRAPALKEEVGVFVSDNLVPVSLHRELVTELDTLSEKEPKDFHPGTYGKVQDLIHPSLYPFVAGTTEINDPSKMPELIDGQFCTTRADMGLPEEYTSPFAWIPSVFRVSADGKDVHIESYINGLGSRERYPRLFQLIEKVFLIALPHFERTLDFKYQTSLTSSEKRWSSRQEARDGGISHSEWTSVLNRSREEKEKEEISKRAKQEQIDIGAREEKQNISSLADAASVSSFKGKDLKVIVKAATYVLKPGQRYEGTWHIEGMPHERVVASAIYYYDTDPAIADAGLSLRRQRDPEMDFPNIFHRHDDFEVEYNDNEDDGDGDGDEREPEKDWPSDCEEMDTDSLTAYIRLGTVPTTNFAPSEQPHGTGRIISFPNWIQHKVAEIKNSEDLRKTNVVAKRKILCFFLVHSDALKDSYAVHHGFRYGGIDDISVLTTTDVPSQEHATNYPTLHFILPVVCRRLINKNLPPELVNHINKYMGVGMSREDAEAYRRGFMEGRKADEERTFSLCEH